MPGPSSKHAPARLAILVAAATAGCTPGGAGTSVRLALAYDDSLGLDLAEVTLMNRTQTAPIAHDVLLLVADDLAGAELPIEVWGRKAGQRTAYGATTALPARGKTVDVALALTTCSPRCDGAVLTTCTSATVTCALGCSSQGDAHCVGPLPSNGVDATLAGPLLGTTSLASDTTIDADSGAITGGLERPAGTGIVAGVGYFQQAGAAGGVPLAIFVFHNLTVEPVAVRFIGTRGVVLLVGDTAQIAGTLDVSAGHDMRSAAGPGGGEGSTERAMSPRCGGGGEGMRNGQGDGGGGGGGAALVGGPGGDGGGGAVPGGLPGAACLAPLLEPLQGGGGGGRGGPGTAATRAGGGGGGGALQITALGSLELTGTIHAGGAGGDAGAPSAGDSGGGGGGGAGGAILLEAPTVVLGSTAILVTKGGGGGGGGGGAGSAGSGVAAAGETADTTPREAQGGFGGRADNPGGTGGGVGPPDLGGTGATASGDGGGGGGSAGVIALRGRQVIINLAAMITPRATQADIKLP